MRRLLLTPLLALLLAGALPAQAAVFAVAPSATGSGSGADWNNRIAWASVSPGTRGNTYCVMEGSYGSAALNTAASGTSTITIKKATTGATECTSLAGWSAALGDTRAVFGDLTPNAPYYVIDGVTRNEANWNDHASYGIKLNSVRSSRLDFSGPCSGSQCECVADNLTFRYVHVGADSTSYPGTGAPAFYLGGFGSGSVACQNWTISRVNIKATFLAVQCAGCFGLLYEYNYHDTGWAKESIRGLGATGTTSNMIVRWSIFKDSCQRDPQDATSGCTGEIASWSGSAGSHDNIEVYGNVFYKTTTEINSGVVVVIGGNGGSWSGAPANNAKVYNNTIAGIKDWHAEILINGGSGNECRNNLWWDNTGSIVNCVGSGTQTNNEIAGSNPFVNYAGGNFRLAAAKGPGTSLASPYNVDMDGVTRGGDGTWDRGAFEFGTGGGPPSAPQNLRIVGWLLTLGTLAALAAGGISYAARVAARARHAAAAAAQ